MTFEQSLLFERFYLKRELRKNSNHFFKIYSKLYIVNRLLDCSSQNRFFQCAPTELCGCKAPEKWDRKRVK